MEKRNLVYSIILFLLCISIVVVMVLILRKRASLPVQSYQKNAQTEVKQPPYTKPIKEYVPGRPWKEGDPTPEAPNFD